MNAEARAEEEIERRDLARPSAATKKSARGAKKSNVCIAGRLSPFGFWAKVHSSRGCDHFLWHQASADPSPERKRRVERFPVACAPGSDQSCRVRPPPFFFEWAILPKRVGCSWGVIPQVGLWANRRENAAPCNLFSYKQLWNQSTDRRFVAHGLHKQPSERPEVAKIGTPPHRGRGGGLSKGSPPPALTWGAYHCGNRVSVGVRLLPEPAGPFEEERPRIGESRGLFSCAGALAGGGRTGHPPGSTKPGRSRTPVRRARRSRARQRPSSAPPAGCAGPTQSTPHCRL